MSHHVCLFVCVAFYLRPDSIQRQLMTWHLLSSSSSPKVLNHPAVRQAATVWKLTASRLAMQLRPLRKLFGGFVLFICLALCYVSIKVSSLGLESLENLESVQSFKSVESLKSMESVKSVSSLSTWEAEALSSVLRVDQWPYGIR